jgi:hypothetical protein
MEQLCAGGRGRLGRLLVLTLTLVLCSTCVLAREEVLAWDDGEADGDGIVVDVGQELLVGFAVPEWACALVGVQFYVAWLPAPSFSSGFLPTVWRCDGGTSSPPSWPVFTNAVGVMCDASDVGSWVEARLSSPVDVGNGTQFPGGRFYLGLESQGAGHARLGVDTDEPHVLRTFHYNYEAWVQVTTGDALIRAIVSDVPTAVERGSWGRVKALFRGD